MSRKATSKKAMAAKELVGILSDAIRNVNNGTMDIQQANAISGSVRTICTVVQTQMKAYAFAKENPLANAGQKLLE